MMPLTKPPPPNGTLDHTYGTVGSNANAAAVVAIASTQNKTILRIQTRLALCLFLQVTNPVGGRIQCSKLSPAKCGIWNR